MTIEVTNKDGHCDLAIQDEMTIYTAMQLKNELLEHLAACHEMDVSLEHVTEMDSAGLQILLMMHKDAKEHNKTIHFSKHSAAVIDVIETLNLAAHFGDPIVMPAEG